ncbi:hypothetical protein FRC01_010147, partial [Tulasnella sp. 417]
TNRREALGVEEAMKKFDGFWTARAVVREGEGWRRLFETFAANGLSQLQDPIGEGMGASSSILHDASAPQTNDDQVGERLTPLAGRSMGASGSGSDLLRASSLGARFGNAEAINCDAHSTVGPKCPKRARKKASWDRGSALKASATAAEEQILPLDSVFAKLATEPIAYIFKLSLEDAVTFEDYNRILQRLVEQEGCRPRCCRIPQDTPSFWTKISASSDVNTALTSSQTRPLLIEGSPDPSLAVLLGLERFKEFISLIKPHKGRSASPSLVFPSNMLRRMKNHLASLALTITTLSLSTTAASLETGLALPLGDALS